MEQPQFCWRLAVPMENVNGRKIQKSEIKIIASALKQDPASALKQDPNT